LYKPLIKCQLFYKEFNLRLNEITTQIDETEDSIQSQIRALDTVKTDFISKLNKKFIEERKQLKLNAEKTKIDKKIETETKKRVRLVSVLIFYSSLLFKILH
jgi:hypothetical protein